MMSSPVISLIVYIILVADSCASRMTPTTETCKCIQRRGKVQVAVVNITENKNTYFNHLMPQDEARRGVAACYKKISKNPCSQGVNPLTPMI